ncbi:hypothetical protein KVP09_10470 [Alcaligenaceae bacterium CGII-47]|nr:hypothetical protein [Alcaligenaceae bacterium CGII-47]
MLTITVKLWGQLALELVPIIGSGGFNSLYARTIHLTRNDFPWLPNEQPPPTADLLFIHLSTHLEQQSAAEASEASICLLTTFLSILATLIGEAMTDAIISSVWNDTALDSKQET